MTGRPRGGDKRGGAVEGGTPYLSHPRLAPFDVALVVTISRGCSNLKVPLDLEDLFAYIDPDWLGYDATLHSERCYTVIILTLDYRYTAWRCNLSDDGRWSMNPLDWAGTFQLVTFDEG